VVRKLGDDLGIGSAISQEAMERIKNNIGKNDSLTSISNSVYFTSVAELEKIDKASTLALVIAGGWIESLYLTTQMIPAYDSTNPAILRIAEQKYTLNNLLNYLSNYAWEHAIAEVITPLAELNSLYEELKEEHINSSLHRKNGKKILSGGSNVLISEGQYALICKKIASIHDQFISGN
jgi:hypothetical protein